MFPKESKYLVDLSYQFHQKALAEHPEIDGKIWNISKRIVETVQEWMLPEESTIAALIDHGIPPAKSGGCPGRQ